MKTFLSMLYWRKQTNRILDFLYPFTYRQGGGLQSIALNLHVALLASSIILCLVKNSTSFSIHQSWQKAKQLNSKHLRKLKNSTSLLRQFDNNNRELVSQILLSSVGHSQAPLLGVPLCSKSKYKKLCNILINIYVED